MSCFITGFDTAGLNAVALEDSIMRKGFPVTAGSKMLENFIAPFDAAVVTRLLEGGAALAGKTEMDEFGIADISEYTPGKISGAVRAIAEGKAACALCNDVFGTYRRESAENGLCYIHPTYGTVSRFGLIPLVSSMDQIGVMCKDAVEGFKLLARIAGNDPRDGAMFPEKSYGYGKPEKKLTVAVPGNFDSPALQDFAANFNKTTINLEHFGVYKQVMYILGCAEISNNISRYDGIKFGYRAEGYKGLEDLYTKTRTEAFGLQTKLAAIMGAMVLSHNQYAPYYEKAMKIRRLIKEAFKFDEYDIIALPVTLGDDPWENLSLHALAPLAGLPSVSFSYKGTGIQLLANVKNEGALLAAWEAVRP